MTDNVKLSEAQTKLLNYLATNNGAYPVWALNTTYEKLVSLGMIIQSTEFEYNYFQKRYMNTQLTEAGTQYAIEQGWIAAPVVEASNVMDKEVKQVTSKRVTLTEAQERLMAELLYPANNNTRLMDKSQYGIHNSRYRKATIDGVLKSGLVELAETTYSDTWVRLTDAGRDYAIAAGWIPAPVATTESARAGDFAPTPNYTDVVERRIIVTEHDDNGERAGGDENRMAMGRALAEWSEAEARAPIVSMDDLPAQMKALQARVSELETVLRANNELLTNLRGWFIVYHDDEKMRILDLDVQIEENEGTLAALNATQ